MPSKRFKKEYRQKQKGGLCMMHSLNGVFGEEVFLERDWNRICDNYDYILREAEPKHEWVIGTTKNMKVFSGGLLDAIRLFSIACRLKERAIEFIPFDTSMAIERDRVLGIISYCRGHAYAFKYYPDEKEWFRVDSRRAPQYVCEGDIRMEIKRKEDDIAKTWTVPSSAEEMKVAILVYNIVG